MHHRLRARVHVREAQLVIERDERILHRREDGGLPLGGAPLPVEQSHALHRQRALLGERGEEHARRRIEAIGLLEAEREGGDDALTGLDRHRGETVESERAEVGARPRPLRRPLLGALHEDAIAGQRQLGDRPAGLHRDLCVARAHVRRVARDAHRFDRRRTTFGIANHHREEPGIRAERQKCVLHDGRRDLRDRRRLVEARHDSAQHARTVRLASRGEDRDAFRFRAARLLHRDARDCRHGARVVAHRVVAAEQPPLHARRMLHRERQVHGRLSGLDDAPEQRFDRGRCVRDDVVEEETDVCGRRAAVHRRERVVYSYVAHLVVNDAHSGAGAAEQKLGERRTDAGCRRRRIDSPAFRGISEWTVHGTRRRVTLQSTNALLRTQDRDTRAATSFRESLA